MKTIDQKVVASSYTAKVAVGASIGTFVEWFDLVVRSMSLTTIFFKGGRQEVVRSDWVN